MPAVDLIDFRYGPLNRYWHTREDTLDKCSAESLEKIGRLILAALPAIEERAARAR
ncbi:MAG: M28 family peptidase [Planctomycetota bacterium]